MPEMIEVEYYRRVAERTVGRAISRVHAPDDWYLKGGTTAAALRKVLRGATIIGTRRIGKLLLLDTDAEPVGIRFGMTGRLLVDGTGPIEKLEYSSARQEPSWIRFALDFVDGGRLEVVDPRRLGGVVLDPSLDHLGVDALDVRERHLRDRLSASRAPIKAWLLDQSHVAGIGNLLADEILWRAGIDPSRPAASLDRHEVMVLHRTLLRTVRLLTKRGGSHTGDLQIARVRGATCPRDGAPLLRRTIGTRTTYSCPVHQH
jgi:formamidopyrimidine-DNA glycosylase